MTAEQDQRFGGTERLYGQEAVELYRNAHIAVIGIGGVGSWAAEALARSAVGEITLIDLDDVCVTNTNRQIHALSSTVGQSKVAVMADRMRDINPDCLVHEVESFVTQDNVRDLLDDRFDYVIDAIDSVGVKAAIIAHCKRNKIPVITVGGAGGQIDPTCITIADLSRTEHDPLAAKLRNLLRRHFGFSKSGRRFAVDCVYSTEQLRYPQPDGSVCQQKTLHDGQTRLDCSGGFGASTCVTATFGFVAVSRVLLKLYERHQRANAG
ncbi:tRNA cyclic N6-threonylcarbamoyladenosine(37) synthase TcdA [Marinobacterium lutimaris]|uniref:tRNA threonylcarbamoyladenosine dehydratase n=1 Tax=Marinobacterium lutimaris TaxID=568106 RepID=A0A1H5XFD7_9GAMM|nr:tRNA cyclic N6-threonylcarbamoyladenosine(37) synthase TcdA [Marinobacterium lutimaris]SEG10478.1 tRNA A37 threonylcarbamoyladenosine dehydratase [Marinobacterium lutimaris]